FVNFDLYADTASSVVVWSATDDNGNTGKLRAVTSDGTHVTELASGLGGASPLASRNGSVVYATAMVAPSWSWSINVVSLQGGGASTLATLQDAILAISQDDSGIYFVTSNRVAKLALNGTEMTTLTSTDYGSDIDINRQSVFWSTKASIGCPPTVGTG